ncbi:MAG: bifunctional oligoribonuclease/PAP phosphatase NrnA [Clostridia bacterium]|nr:bifunctional oligoribonuclease/PAP phosphatase NrnA [Clostridia bacterium]
MRNPEALREIADHLRAAQRIAVCAHLNPDGDCIGSALAVRLILTALGKEVEVFDRDKVPDNLSMLAGADTVRTLDQATGRYDTLLCVDCAELSRVVNFGIPEQKAAFDGLRERCGELLQIDHHPSNPGYGDCHVIDGNAAATCVMIYDLMGLLGVKATREIAECLYTGISTDTGNFLQDNTNEDALAVIAALQETGFDQAALGRKLFAERRPEQVALISRALNTLRYDETRSVTCMTLTLGDFEETGALPEDADTIVNFGRDIRGVHMALLARETVEGVKMSLRSVSPYEIVEVARKYGGGGHEMAAGCTVKGIPLQAAADAVFADLCIALQEQKKA